ncbi:MAG: mannonate dehydratase [Oscillospiraceae bacterium]|nr:mannonate dehydratase [Oscillospiraceae bacterium]
MINLAMAYFYDEHAAKIALAKQIGVTHVVTNVAANASHAWQTIPAGERPWDYIPLLRKVQSYEDSGLKVSVIEGPTPLDKVKLGLDGKDEEIEIFCEFLRTLGRMGIHTVCYNWMPIIGWFRTNLNAETRGGAHVTAYRDALMKDAPLTDAGIVPPERLWKNLEYFLKSVVPVAEESGVRLAVHPDDPPVPSLRGISRILIKADAFQRLIDLIPSEYNGITMCQGSFSAMGEDIPAMIEHFGHQKKIFFAHFRDVRGTAVDFTETFHDDGQTDMYECMKKYREIGFDGCMRPDHVPVMAGEDNINPGYGILGNLFAVGYMKGLIESVWHD